MSERQAVTDRMASLIRGWEAAADRRAIFLNCYLLMTRNMLSAVDAGDFRDCDWVHALLYRFADYYFDALVVYDEDRERAPAVWRYAHDVAGRRAIQPLQHLLLGVNAHINYDLVLTLVEMLEPEWERLTPQQRAARYADHCHVNEIIAATVDAVQDDVIEPTAPKMDLVDKLLGPLDEWLIARLISRWRQEVWEHAVIMLASPAQQRETQRAQVEALTHRRARAILLAEGTDPLADLW